MPNDGRAVSGWFYSRDDDHGLSARGEHLGIGGQSGHTGKLIFQSGADFGDAIAGKTAIPRWEWNHVTFVRDEDRVSVYLNGRLEIETTATLATSRQLFWGGRSDNDSNWEGRLDEIALFDRALTKDEVAQLPILTGKGH
jgi:hypothetical protein